MPWLHAVGDVTGTQTSTAAANAIGRRLVRRLALPLLPGLSRPPLIPAAVYTDPEVASVGPTLAALRLRYPPELVVTRRIALAGLDRAKTDGLGEGFLVVHALRIEGRILSATWVAPHAADMLPVLSLAIQKRVSLFALTRLAFPYPSLAASLKGVAEEFLVDTLRELRRELLTYLRYRFRPGRGRRAVQQPEKRWASARKGETHEWK